MNADSDVKQSPVTYINQSDLEDRFESFFQFHGEAVLVLSPKKGKIPGWSVIDIDIIDFGFPINKTHKQLRCKSLEVDKVQSFIREWFLKRYNESECKYVRH